MIDWTTKIAELKAIADDLDLWAGKTDGRLHLVLGRTADELRRFAHQIQVELNPPSEPAAPVEGWPYAEQLDESEADYYPADDGEPKDDQESY